MEPSLLRAPVITDGSVLATSAVLQELLMFHELPEAVDEPRLTPAPLARARLFVRTDVELPNLKPPSPLRNAVSWSTVMVPGLPLSMNPPTALSNEKLLRMMWLAGGSGSPPPILKPLPSPT